MSTNVVFVSPLSCYTSIFVLIHEIHALVNEHDYMYIVYVDPFYAHQQNSHISVRFECIFASKSSLNKTKRKKEEKITSA